MAIESDYGEIILSTGKILRPNAGYVGIDEAYGLCEGYDGAYTSSLDRQYDAEDAADTHPYNTTLTDVEAIELADIMIARWTAFKSKLTERGNG